MKDKEWLKDEVSELYPSYDEMYVSPYYETVAKTETISKVLELIDQLDEPEVLSEEWIENHTASADTISYYSEESVPVITVSNLKGLLVPNQDKPVIPQFVADWIDAHNLHGNNPLREYRDLESDFTEGWTDEKDAAVYHWVNENPYAFIDALRYGYEVEKEKLYYVLDKEDATLLKKTAREGVAKSVGTNMCSVKSWKDEEKYQLTEQEIKDYDERYWAFAQEVTQ